MAALVPVWLWWLAAPMGAALLAALVIWFAGRPPRPPTVARSIRDHGRFLAALGTVGSVRPDRSGGGSA